MRKIAILSGLILGILLIGSRWGIAADPVFLSAFPESTYTITQSTVSISSSTAVLIAESNNRFRELYVGDPDSISALFYRIDGVSTDIATVGWWVPAGTGQKIESNNDVYAIMEAGAATDIFRIISITK